MRLGLSSGGKCDGLPRLAQLVEHLTVVVKTNVSADIRVSPVQVWERGLNLQSIGLSPLNREVHRFHLLPLSWERGPL